MNIQRLHIHAAARGLAPAKVQNQNWFVRRFGSRLDAEVVLHVFGLLQISVFSLASSSHAVKLTARSQSGSKPLWKQFDLIVKEGVEAHGLTDLQNPDAIWNELRGPLGAMERRP
ncbi:hypothetical protein ACJ73_03712 [Blastomyces percursus]|uniref:Uncharacterized protein n=1 Tax=Blastomyces percursus TaxID=1658174 RepID=A0A1J9Q8X3_9EURO|nr:hypothetical protein ACJ73_03712 [Blastomyces percursus]